jgi:hypothetical protein
MKISLMRFVFIALLTPLFFSSFVVKRTTYDSHKGTKNEKYVIKRPIKEALNNSE